MRLLCVFGRHAYGDPAKGEGYEHANFLPALRKLGHEIEFFDSLDRSRYRDFAELNRELLRTAEAFKPDVVLCVLMHFEVWLETIEHMRADLGAVVINWGTDDSWRYEQFSKFIARVVDLYATTDADAFAKAQRDGIDSFLLTQWAASGETIKAPIPSMHCRFDVSFVGAAYGNRPRWIDRLAQHGIRVECFGTGWPAGAVDTTAMRSIIRSSRVVLNFGDSGLQWRGLLPYRSRQIKARTFEVPGAGGLLITERAPRLEQFYKVGKEIEDFASPEELAAKIRRYLADPGLRDQMATAGHVRTCNEHLYEHRFAVLIETALGKRLRDRDVRRAAVNWPAFERVAGRHRTSGFLRLLGAIAIFPFRTLFGPVRGPRAARRITFEITWRLAGEGAFRAAGLPGRLFYAQS